MALFFQNPPFRISRLDVITSYSIHYTKLYDHVKEGDAVRKGQVLVDLDVKVLNQSLQQVKTQYEFAKTVFEKQKYLWEKKIGSEIQYLQAKNNKEALEQNIATLKEQIV